MTPLQKRKFNNREPYFEIKTEMLLSFQSVSIPSCNICPNLSKESFDLFLLSYSDNVRLKVEVTFVPVKISTENVLCHFVNKDFIFFYIWDTTFIESSSIGNKELFNGNPFKTSKHTFWHNFGWLFGYFWGARFWDCEMVSGVLILRRRRFLPNCWVRGTSGPLRGFTGYYPSPPKKTGVWWKGRNVSSSRVTFLSFSPHTKPPVGVDNRVYFDRYSSWQFLRQWFSLCSYLLGSNRMEKRCDTRVAGHLF